MNDNLGETCVRCGEVGEDRRTLKMGCFYAMEELPVPFEQMTVFTAPLETLEITEKAKTIKTPQGVEIPIVPPKLRCSGELTPQALYTLRVCKDCRSSWMEAISAWFRAPASADAGKRSVGTGIFVRRHGTNVEVTEEEWCRLAEQNGKADLAPARAAVVEADDEETVLELLETLVEKLVAMQKATDAIMAESLAGSEIVATLVNKLRSWLAPRDKG